MLEAKDLFWLLLTIWLTFKVECHHGEVEKKCDGKMPTLEQSCNVEECHNEVEVEK